MPDLSGLSIGRYIINEKLGEGGMAIVYRAQDTHLDVKVAIKMIRTEMFGPAVLGPLLKRFEREAKTLANLQHPNIVHVMDYGEYNNTPYLVMEYLQGGTLKTLTGKPMPYHEAARLLAPIARALAYAHQEGIVHRDVKPANILLTKTGIPMLTDFGIAKILEADQSTQLTATGMSIGTPEYMAPEQWAGDVSPKVDIYAVGVLLYELVTGRRPYTADTPAALMVQSSMDPLPPPRKFVPNLPVEVEKIIVKALAKQPQNRYSNMTEFATVLELLAKSNEAERHQLMPVGEKKEPGGLNKPVSKQPTRMTRLSPATVVQSAPGSSRQIQRLVWLVGGASLLGIVIITIAIALVIVLRNRDNQVAIDIPTVTITHPATQPATESPTATPASQNTATATIAHLPTTAPTTAPNQDVAPNPNVKIFPIDSTTRMDYTSIWSMTSPKFTDLKSPGTQTYTAKVNPQEQYRWEFAWCAVDNQALQNILTPLSLWFVIDNGQPVNETVISISRGKSYQGMECQYWDILLGGWVQDKEVKLDISISLSDSINDGIDVYEAGSYHQIIFVIPK